MASTQSQTPEVPASGTPSITDEVLAACRIFTRSVWDGNYVNILPLLDDSIAFAAARSRTYIYGRREVARVILEAVQSRGTPGTFKLLDEHYTVRPLSSDSCLATAQYHVQNTDSGTGRRITSFVSSMVWARASNARGWALLLCHNSQSAVVAGSAMTTQGASGRIALHAHDTANTTHWVLPDEVVFLKASRQYTEVHCVDRCLRLRGSFASVLTQLEQTVVKIHRSYAVNPAFVERLSGEMLYLQTGEKLPVPARRVSQVRRLLSEPRQSKAERTTR